MDNPAPTTEEREQFEAWVAERRRKKLVCPIKMDWDPHFRKYLYLEASIAWASWQAARRTAPDVRAIRAAALEEAANLADEMILYAGCDIANALRALAAKKDET